MTDRDRATDTTTQGDARSAATRSTTVTTSAKDPSIADECTIAGAATESLDTAQLLERAADETDPAVALTLYLRIRELAPWHAEAAEGITRCYEATGRWEALASWLERLAAGTVSGSDKAKRLVRLAEVRRRYLDDEPRALEALRDAAAADSRCVDAWRELTRLHLTRDEDTAGLAALDGHVAAVGDEVAGADACASAAGLLFARGDDDATAALAVTRRGLRLAPAHAGCQRLLEQILEAEGELDELVAVCRAHANTEGDPQRRRDAWLRLARVSLDWLEDPEGACSIFESLLAVDPSDREVLERLAKTRENMFDDRAAATAYERLATFGDHEQRVAAYVAAARVHLGDGERRFEALSCYRRALEIDPLAQAARMPLLQLMLEADQVDDIVTWLFRDADAGKADVSVLADALAAEQIGEHPESDRARWHVTAAKVAAVVDDDSARFDHLHRAHELDPCHPEPLVALAQRAERDGDRDAAIGYWVRLVETANERDDAWAEAATALARFDVERDAMADARTRAEGVLDTWPEHEGALRVLERVYLHQDEFECLADVKASLCAIDPDDGERFLELAVLCEGLDDAAGAMSAYAAAVELVEDKKPVLLALLEVCGKAQAWAQVLTTLEKLITVESSPTNRLGYRWAAVEVVRDRLGRAADAVGHLEAIIAADPSSTAAYDQLDTLYVAAGEWRRAERAYRRELTHLGTERPPRRLELWRKLAWVYDQHLDDPQSAIASYEAVLGLDEYDSAARARLVALYDTLVADDFARYGDAAVRQHQRRLASEPHAADSLHALFELYRRGGDMDKAYCTASVLALIRQASRSQIDVVERYRRPELVQSQVGLPEAIVRQHLLHGDLDVHLLGIFALLAPALVRVHARKLPAELRRRPAISPTTDDSALARLVDYARRVLGVAAPDVHVHPQLGRDYAWLAVRDGEVARLVLCIDDATLRSRDTLPFAFELGRELLGLFPPFQPYYLLGDEPERLHHVLAAGLRLAGAGVGKGEREVESIVRKLGPHLAPGVQAGLARFGASFLETGGVVDLERFMQSVERTAIRAGLMLCGEVSVAADAIAHARPMAHARLDRKAQLREVIGFAVSDDYFALRQRMGVKRDRPARPSSRVLPRPAGLT